MNRNFESIKAAYQDYVKSSFVQAYQLQSCQNVKQAVSSVPAVCEFWLKSVSWRNCHFAPGDGARILSLLCKFFWQGLYVCDLASGTHLKSRFAVRVVTPPSFWPFHRRTKTLSLAFLWMKAPQCAAHEHSLLIGICWRKCALHKTHPTYPQVHSAQL